MNTSNSKPTSERSDWRFTLFALGVLAAAILFIFGRPLFTDAAFFPPADGAPFFRHDRQFITLQSLWGAWQLNALGSGSILSLVPTRLLAILFPPLTGHLLRFISGTVLLALATAFFLHGRGFRKHALWLPSIGLAFSGYFFTLVSAGHGGFFDMTPFAVFVFGCADRGFRHRSPYWFGWAGVCAALGLSPQPDMMALYGVLALIYCLFLFFEQRPKPAAPGAWGHYLGALGIGAVVAIVLAAAVAASGLARATHALETRERVRGETAEEKWEFATNWSMPPEELLDLAAPFVYGIETGDPDGPYWGRVGRSLNWRETRQGLMNLKQHSLYLGLIPLIFGFYAFIGSVFERKRHRIPPQDNTASQDERSVRRPVPTLPGWHREVWFWSAVFGVSVILAMGRFTPVYRLFYALPFFSRIRAPVKFIHLAELALAVLFAYGLALFLSKLISDHNAASSKDTSATKGKKEFRERSSSRHKKRHADKAHTATPVAAVSPRIRGMALFLAFAAGCGILGILFGITALILPALPALREYWQDIGFGAHAGLLAGVMRGGLLRATLLSFIGAAVFALPLFNLRVTRHILLCVLWITVTVDIATVGRRYVRIGDLDPWYNRNPVADRILADPEPGRLSFHLGPSVRRNWTFGNLRYHGVDMLQPSIGDLGMPEIYQRFFGALQNHPVRLWEITNTRYVLGPREQFAQLIEHPAFSEVMSFDLRGGRFIPETYHGPYVLLEFQAATPRAAVFLDWEIAEPDTALQRLADPQFPARRRAVVSDDIPLPDDRNAAAATETGRAEIKRYGRTRIDIETQSPAPALLVLKDRYDPRWRVTVNGEPAEVLRCNFMMRGIRIPTGQSTVRMVFRPNLPYFLVSLAGILIMLGWWMVKMLKR